VTGDTGTGTSTGGVGGTNPISLATTAAELAASAESSAQTYEDDASVSQQIQNAVQARALWLRLLAERAQGQAAANANHTAQVDGTNGPPSVQGATRADGLNLRALATGGSTATSGGSSGNSLNTSLGVSKSGPLVPALILALVLVFGLTAIVVRRRTRRAAAVPCGLNGDLSATDGD